MVRLRQIFPHFINSVLNSYSQIFFSNSKIFAVILVVVSFFDLNAGVSGLIAVLTSNAAAYIIGFNREKITAGYYGFNSLLVGLGLGIYYQMQMEFLLILIFASAFTLFVTVVLEGVIGKYGLPYLSISFLLGIWTVTLASRTFTALSISERGIFMPNELYDFGGEKMVYLYYWFSNLNLHESIVTYFRSLGAIFFQYHLFAGILLAIGLLIYSRIAFLLSLIGFFSAYLFYQIVGGSFQELSYSYIGFNFILSAIAIGGFFIIPSRYSFLWVILLVPLISICITSTMTIMSLFQLSIYSLPFNLVVITFLYIMKFRERYFNKPEFTIYQQFSPEKNLYSQLNSKERFYNFKYIQFSLPFWGEWKVTQAHRGEYTHKNEWAHAWDFEISGDRGLPYKSSGTICVDYYCYKKPLICPADGWVEEVLDGIEDNEIGDSNLEHNWGNTIVIRHNEKLYSKLSHIRKESFKVKKGDFVKKGDILASCGNSGRSPEPHVHFQIQETPFIGSKTLDYPLGHYIQHVKDGFKLMSYAKPSKNDNISNVDKNLSLYKAFHFVPGQQLKFMVRSPISPKEKIVIWEVQTDIYNNALLYCPKTKSKAWFKNDGSIHYFTHFEGNRNSLLFYFYLGAYKVISGFYKGLKINDVYPIHLLNNRGLIFLQDFIAPFYLFIKSEFNLEYLKIKDNLTDSNILFKSKATVKHGSKKTRELNFEFEIESNRIKKMIVIAGEKIIEASEVSTELTNDEI